MKIIVERKTQKKKKERKKEGENKGDRSYSERVIAQWYVVCLS